jgi:4-hydroxy-tetrahydrodipicolinate reductase
LKPLRLAVVGASGRMGRGVIRLAPEYGFSVVRAIAREAAGQDAGVIAGSRVPLGVLVQRDVSALLPGGFDVVVDFSSPETTFELAQVAMSAGAALVSGTTGLGVDGERELAAASLRVPVLWEPNMSFGVHVLVELVRRAALQLGADFDVEISETHHRMKADAPSGTAGRLLAAVQEAKGAQSRGVHGRNGRPGPRPADEIAVHALRGGDVIGDHTVHFLGAGERLEFTHRATDRDLFVRGALRAAAAVAGKPPGRYGMSDLLP